MKHVERLRPEEIVELPERSDHTAIGATVNTASLGLAQVRGKTAAVEVFTLS